MDGHDVVVVGGGHAGSEAALAAARLGCRTALVTPTREIIARMSCNPAIGGLGKGHLVREIDALGGEMARAIDETGIQFRLLNRSRGPAVRGPRAQADRERYAARVRRAVEAQRHLTIVEGLVGAIHTETAPGGRRRVAGIVLEDGREIPCRALVVTTGTFLRGRLHVGSWKAEGGRIGEPSAVRLSESLAELGLRTGRLKTGTSPRLSLRSVDLDRLGVQPGDVDPVPFSFLTDRIPQPQIRCYLARTNPQVHGIVRAHLDRSPLFDGSLRSPGPRYCPSLEDKVTRFPDRDGHPLILEPEGYASDVVYVNGLSTSLPEEVQTAIVRSIHGLEAAEILRPGYAVEYDFVDPRQLGSDLQVLDVAGLFLAGQIDGTTGYEEAAALGIIAGIGAASLVGACRPFVPARAEAYIGVLIDDLITKGTREPYRMFTSRAEFRLLLDIDSADRRLTPHGRRIGLVDDARWERFIDRRQRVDRALAWVRSQPVNPSHDMRRRVREGLGVELGARAVTLDRLLARASVRVGDLHGLIPEDDALATLDAGARAYVECRVKYDGYLKRQQAEVRRLAGTEERPIPPGFEFRRGCGLSAEVVEKLEQVRPQTLGQASRIPGLTPPALSLLDIHLRHHEKATSGRIRRGSSARGNGARHRAPARGRQRDGGPL